MLVVMLCSFLWSNIVTNFDMLLHGHDDRVLNTLHPTRNPNLWPRGCIMQLAKAPELSASENMSAKMARFAPWQGGKATKHPESGHEEQKES